MSDRRARSSRAEWQKRVARWRDSGLSAEDFAAELGVNAGTLRQWKYALKREAREGSSNKAMPSAASFVEVQSALSSSTPSAGMFQLELGRARRLHIGSDFDAAALERLLSLLERT